MLPVVLLTDETYRKGQAVFDAVKDLQIAVEADEEEGAFARAVKRYGAKHAIVGVFRYQGALYEALPRGGVLARFGVGHDGIDKHHATECGLLCTNTPGVLDQSVAEFTMLLIASTARDVITMSPRMRAGEWRAIGGRELAGKRLAIIGCGPIGRAVARIAFFGYALHVIGCDPVVQHQPGLGFERIVTDYFEAVDGADYVSLHIPSTPATRHFLNAERLAAIPDTAWVVNTARGAVVDEVALYDALAQGRLAGAALDVFEREPYVPADPEHDLRRLPNVLLTPHSGSNTAEANRRMAERALANIRMAEAGDYAAMDLLNPEVLKLLLG